MNTRTRIVSFDVGIKNLAYCVFDVNPKTPSWTVAGWTCANLLALDSPAETPHLCTQIVTKGKKADRSEHRCNKTAKWTPPTAERTNRSGEEYYCETHAKMHTEWIIPKTKHKSSHIRKLKVPELRTEWQTICANTEIDKDKSLKRSDLIERIETYYKSKCFRSVLENTPKTKTAGETDLVTIGRAIRRQLDEDPATEGVTHVIIENQISTVASRMKTIQGMIAQYFIMRFGDKVTIEFVSSHNKLKGFLETTRGHKEPKTEKEKTTYKANKTDGVLICRRFFAANAEMNAWSNTFEKSKKRDDLADCFLQGVWYLKSNKIIYYAEDLKINSVFVS